MLMFCEVFRAVLAWASDKGCRCDACLFIAAYFTNKREIALGAMPGQAHDNFEYTLICRISERTGERL